MFQFNKRRLTGLLVCFVFTLSIFSQSAFATSTLGMLSHSSFYDSNSLYVVGEVKNTGDVAIQNVNVKVIFYNAADQVITSITGYTDLNVVLIGRKTFFSIKMLESQGALNVTRYTTWFNWTDAPAGKPLGLSILSTNESTDSDGHRHITGTIQNQGTVNSNNTEVSVTFYNSTQGVVGTAWAFANPPNLAPNQIATFDVELIFVQQVAKVASYSMAAESNSLAYSPMPSVTPSPSPSATVNPSVSSSPSPSTTVNPSVSSSPTPQGTNNPTQSPTNSPTSNPSVMPSQSVSPQPSGTQNSDPLTATTDNSGLLIAIGVVSVAAIVVASLVFLVKKRGLLKSV